MMITEEMIAEDEKRWNDRNIVAELGYCGKNIRHRKNITKDDIRFYAYIMRKAHAMLKEQEAVVRCKDCKHYRYYGLSQDTVSECMLDICTNQNEDWFCAEGERAEQS